jgi:hypothetical protein
LIEKIAVDHGMDLKFILKYSVVISLLANAQLRHHAALLERITALMPIKAQFRYQLAIRRKLFIADCTDITSFM